MKRILLTGSAGYIGSKIAAAIRGQADTKLFSFDEFGDKGRWEQRFHELFDHQHYDWVIHAGAIMDPEYKHSDMFWWNYQCTTRIADYCRNHANMVESIMGTDQESCVSVLPAPKLLFFSSCQAIQPYNHYAWIKRCASDYIQSNFNDYCIVRPFVVFGDEYGRTSKYSPVAKLIKGELPVMFEPWERDWIHVRDVVRSIVHIVDNDLSGVYDLGTGKGHTARELFERWGEPLPPVVGPGEPPYPEDAPESLVATRLLPDFETKYNVLEYLDEMKSYGNKVY